MKKTLLYFNFFFLLANCYAQRICLEGNCENGYGRLKEGNYVFRGHFVDGKQVNGDIFNIKSGYIYSGAFVNGKLEGEDVMVANSDNIFRSIKYIAKFKNGVQTDSIAAVILKGNWVNILSGPTNEKGLFQGYGKVYYGSFDFEPVRSEIEGKVKFDSVYFENGEPKTAKKMYAYNREGEVKVLYNIQFVPPFKPEIDKFSVFNYQKSKNTSDKIYSTVNFMKYLDGNDVNTKIKAEVLVRLSGYILGKNDIEVVYDPRFFYNPTIRYIVKKEEQVRILPYPKRIQIRGIVDTSYNLEDSVGFQPTYNVFLAEDALKKIRTERKYMKYASEVLDDNYRIENINSHIIKNTLNTQREEDSLSYNLLVNLIEERLYKVSSSPDEMAHRKLICFPNKIKNLLPIEFVVLQYTELSMSAIATFRVNRIFKDSTGRVDFDYTILKENKQGEIHRQSTYSSYIKKEIDKLNADLKLTLNLYTLPYKINISNKDGYGEVSIKTVYFDKRTGDVKVKERITPKEWIGSENGRDYYNSEKVEYSYSGGGNTEIYKALCACNNKVTDTLTIRKTADYVFLDGTILDTDAPVRKIKSWSSLSDVESYIRGIYRERKCRFIEQGNYNKRKKDGESSYKSGVVNLKNKNYLSAINYFSKAISALNEDKYFSAYFDAQTEWWKEVYSIKPTENSFGEIDIPIIIYTPN